MYSIKKIEPIKVRRCIIWKYAVVDSAGNEMSYHATPWEARQAIMSGVGHRVPGSGQKSGFAPVTPGAS